VWLGSNRCVVREHATLSPQDDRFWDWSVDELARYDVPCIVDHVLGVTGTAHPPPDP
jgi:lysosomal acid lipase/cholesteryl ester hydrolase